jgi:inhibitor of KinA
MSESLSWRFLLLGEGALLLDASSTSTLANRYVLAVAELLMQSPPQGVTAAVPALRSLLVTFDPLEISAADLQAYINKLLHGAAPAPVIPGRIVTVPVRYGGDHGPDLAEVGRYLSLSEAQVVALHCGQVYRVMMVGFAPGFPYIGPLPEALTIPRRSTPRVAVPAGSVALAAGLTGVYPTRLPGGWHVIGQTHLQLFEPASVPPALLQAGDGVRFEPVEGGVIP